MGTSTRGTQPIPLAASTRRVGKEGSWPQRLTHVDPVSQRNARSVSMTIVSIQAYKVTNDRGAYRVNITVEMQQRYVLSPFKASLVSASTAGRHAGRRKLLWVTTNCHVVCSVSLANVHTLVFGCRTPAHELHVQRVHW